MSAPLSPTVLDGFGAWLRDEEKLAETTVAQRVIDVRTLVKVCTEKSLPPARLHFAAKYLAEWAEEHDVDLASLEPGLGWLLSEEARKEATGASKRRKKKARSFAPADWKKLATAVRKAEAKEARVCEVALVTALRIGDVLRIERAQIERAVSDGVMKLRVKGGKERELYVRGVVKEALERLLDAWNATGPKSAKSVSAWVLPESRDPRPYFAAYQRCSRFLKKLGEELSLDGTIHLHRMRRTVAMQALAVTKDLGAVQQLLGHSDPATTQRYLDEERPEDVARLSEQVHKTFLDGDE